MKKRTNPDTIPNILYTKGKKKTRKELEIIKEGKKRNCGVAIHPIERHNLLKCSAYILFM